MKGWALARQRLWALLVKRSCCARRDRLAVVTQLAVPILLVVVALWAGKAYVNSPDEPPLVIGRCGEHGVGNVCVRQPPSSVARCSAVSAA